jgi:uncharacterized protein
MALAWKAGIPKGIEGSTPSLSAFDREGEINYVLCLYFKINSLYNIRIFIFMPNQKRVFIIHGWGAAPDSDWLPWLAKNLKERGFLVEVPEMPDTDNPKIEAWVERLQRAVGKCDEKAYFIGGSIGCQAIMRYFEKLPEDEISGGAVFVAGWITLTGLDSEEERFTSSPWVNIPIDFEKVRNHAKKFICIFSDNDSYVPAENWEIFSEKLGAEIIMKKGQGHFKGDDDGITELPVALEAILKVASEENEK